VTGRHHVEAELLRPLHQGLETHDRIAAYARVGRAAGAIFIEEVVIHLAAEDLLGVDHHVANARALAHRARVVDRLERAAAALRGARIAVAVVLHGQADHVVARFREGHGGNARVDAAAHREQDVRAPARFIVNGEILAAHAAHCF
jgi:hypothetical protein